MAEKSSYIYIDYTNNLWKFYLKGMDLCYRVMYDEGKWTKENIIDKNVISFAFFVNNDNTIHIAYSNADCELKYCTMYEKKWVGKNIYEMNNDEAEIKELKMKIIGNKMHIFFLAIDNAGRDHGVLYHFIWDGKETKVTKIQDIILLPELSEHYLILLNGNNKIYMFYLTDEGDEISLNNTIFSNGKWSSIKRLYGIQGEDVGFEAIVDDDDMHILNRSKEDLVYFLEYVFIDINGKIKEVKVRESANRLINPILCFEYEKLYTCWIEENKIFYSLYDGEKWLEPHIVEGVRGDLFNNSDCFEWNEEENMVQYKKVYVNDDLDIKMYTPSDFIEKSDGIDDEINSAFEDEDLLKSNDEIRDIILELSKVKSEKNKLIKKVEYLNNQLEKNAKFMNEYEERMNLVLEQKRKADENYSIFLELHQKTQKELEAVKKQNNVKSDIEDTYKQKLDEYKEKIDALENIVSEKEKEISDFNTEVNELKVQVENLNSEKDKIAEELEIERNQSFMDRLLRKKPDGI